MNPDLEPPWEKPAVELDKRQTNPFEKGKAHQPCRSTLALEASFYLSTWSVEDGRNLYLDLRIKESPWAQAPDHGMLSPKSTNPFSRRGPVTYRSDLRNLALGYRLNQTMQCPYPAGIAQHTLSVTGNYYYLCE